MQAKLQVLVSHLLQVHSSRLRHPQAVDLLPVGVEASSGTHGAATAVVVSDVRALLGVFLMAAISVAGGLLSLA
jgi:hypothetical protein